MLAPQPADKYVIYVVPYVNTHTGKREGGRGGGRVGQRRGLRMYINTHSHDTIGSFQVTLTAVPLTHNMPAYCKHTRIMSLTFVLI